MKNDATNGTAAAALSAHSKDAHPSAAGATTGGGADSTMIDDLVASATKMSSEASAQLGEVVHDRPVVSLFVAGLFGMVLGLVIARR